MLFITNRALEQSLRSRRNRRVSFDMDNNEPQASVFFCEKHEDGMTEIMSEPFLDRLRDSKVKEILIYVHGFNNTPDSAFEAGGKLQKRCDEMAKGDYLVLPLIWPNGAKPGIVRDYYDDQDRADGSSIAYARTLAMFLDWRAQHDNEAGCLKRINLLSHSMGNRVSVKTLERWRERGAALPRVFRNVFLVAADVPNEVLERGEPGQALVDAARTVTVYHADDDLALRASKVANVRNRELTRRLGHTGPEDMNRTPSHVFSVDCNDFNHAEDPGAGHNYFTGTAFSHMMFTLKTGRVDVSDEFVIPDNHPRAVRLLSSYPKKLPSADINAGERRTLTTPDEPSATERA
jgi:esterase/lipase superfamily enzyme